MTLLQRTVVYAMVLIICDLAGPQSIFAQQAAEKFGLKIKIEEGDDSSSPVKLPAPGPKIVVQDANNQPVAGALVVFTAPEAGSGGFFEGGTRSVSVTTDRNGRAEASGYQTNAIAGTYEIQVHAQFLNETADAAVTHTNVGAAKSSKKMIAILAIAGAGAAGVILKASGGGGGNSTPTPTLPTISFGGATVGAPSP
jgi:hypothetical protein